MGATGHDAATVQDELEVRNLLARLARLADEGDLDEYLTVFTEDAVMELPGGPPRTGHAGLRAGAEAGRSSGATGPGSHTIHLLHQSHVVVDGDEATSTTAFTFLRDTAGTPTVALVGRYHDRFRRTPEGWKLAHRRTQVGL